MNNNVKNNSLVIMAQAFYGNRTGTEVKKEKIDSFILGHLDGEIPATEKVDRTIINVPNTDNVVIVYNKYQEEKRLLRKEEVFKTENYEFKPLVIIPEKGIELYSRCIVCRINENGELKSLEKEDYEKFMKYLAE